MKKRYWMFISGILIIWMCAAAAKTIDNINTPVVSFEETKKGRLEYSSAVEGVLEASETYRVRCPVDLIIEDVFIKEGDYIQKGAAILTVYDKSLEKAIGICDDEQLNILSEVKNNSYTWIADRDMYITEVCISEDCSLSADALLYKYAPSDCTAFTAQFELDDMTASKFSAGDMIQYTYTYAYDGNERVYLGEAEIIIIENNIITCLFKDQEALCHGERVMVSFHYETEMYDHIISSSVLHRLDESDKYRIYYAVPAEEDGKYTVIESEAKILESNGKETAIEFSYSDGRKIIRDADGNIFHGCIVRS